MKDFIKYSIYAFGCFIGYVGSCYIVYKQNEKRSREERNAYLDDYLKQKIKLRKKLLKN